MLRPGHAYLAVLLLVACGRIDGGSSDSTTGSETGGAESAGGSNSGQNETGGERAAGGNHATGGGHTTGGAEPGTATGGLATNLPEPWGPCNYEHPGLEPPCGESDVNGLLSSCGLWFDVPLAHIVPPAMNLQVVLLPLAQDGATGGMGGMGDVPNQPLVLDVISVFPTEPPWESGGTFDLVEPAGYVRAGNRGGDVPGYVMKAEEYGVAVVALQQGTESLSVYRGLYTGAPLDVCVK